MGILKAMLVILSIACLVAGFAATCALARLEGRWALQSGNAFIGSTMHKAYDGSVQSPTWIDPNDNASGVFNQINMNTILDLAHKKTLPGARIAPALWDL